MLFKLDHFRTSMNANEAETLFKQSVLTIEISISSFCNRRCPYCPNAYVDRISQNHLMSDELFTNIMAQLSTIDFTGDVHINRYNEPLADRTYVLRRLREIRANLPNCAITLFTNGDYLDASYVSELSEAGVTAIFATVHEAANGTSFAKLLVDQDHRMARLGLPFVYSMNGEQNVRVAHVQTGSAMSFVYVAQDFHRRDANGVLWMEDRGQSLAVKRGMVRSIPCFMPFVQMQIEWDGELLPCCQIQPDAFAKNKYTLGRLTQYSNIFLEWTNTQYVQWRKDLLSYEIKKPPCSTCSYGGLVNDTPENKARINEWRKTQPDAVSEAPPEAYMETV